MLSSTGDAYQLDWCDDESYLNERFDCVIGADVAYEVSVVPDLVRATLAHVADDGFALIVGERKRPAMRALLVRCIDVSMLGFAQTRRQKHLKQRDARRPRLRLSVLVVVACDCRRQGNQVCCLGPAKGSRLRAICKRLKGCAGGCPHDARPDRSCECEWARTGRWYAPNVFCENEEPEEEGEEEEGLPRWREQPESGGRWPADEEAPLPELVKV